MYITPLQSILKELEEIQEFLEITPSEDPNEAVYRGNQIGVYMARSLKLLADAKYHQDEKLKSSVIAEIKQLLSLPPSLANKFIDTLTKEENYAVVWAERINRTCSHQMDWSRTIISKAKAEMQANI